MTFLTPAADLTGGQRVVATHADYLSAQGHDVTVVTRERPPMRKYERIKHLAKCRMWPTAPKNTHFERMKARVLCLPYPGPVLPSDLPEADIVIATWWETAFEIVHLPKSKGKKFYFVQHHEVFSHLPNHISGGSYFLPLKKIAVSSWLIDTMSSTYGDDCVSLVPNSVDHTLFYPSSTRRRREFPTVGFIYSAAPYKGTKIAINALNKARETCPNLRVIAFGANPPTAALPLPKDVEFVLSPAQKEIRHIYQSCDFFLSSSLSEGFGLPILEAMACGTPVIATRTGCAEDIVLHGKNGYLAKVGDEADFSQKIVTALSDDPSIWRSMSRAAEESTRDYTWDDAGALFEQALLIG